MAGVLPDAAWGVLFVSLLWAVLLVSLLAAAVALLVLRLLHRTRPLMPYVVRGARRLRDGSLGVALLGVPAVVLAVVCLVVLGACVLVLASLLLMGLGLGVRDLSTVVGTPLPDVHDDPNRIEWRGLAELVGYGLAGALVLYALYVLGRRVLPATARRHIGRVIGVAVLLAVAATAVWATLDGGDLRTAGFAVAGVYGAYRVARGLPLVVDDDDDERLRGGSPHDDLTTAQRE